MSKPELLLPCECYDLSHVIRVSSFDEDHGTVSIEFLVAPRSLANRLRYFWKSLFGYGLFHDVVLSRQQAQQLCEWLEKKTP